MIWLNVLLLSFASASDLSVQGTAERLGYPSRSCSSEEILTLVREASENALLECSKRFTRECRLVRVQSERVTDQTKEYGCRAEAFAD
jgi:hypothetical protein